MAKSVFDVLIEKIDGDLSSAQAYLTGGGPKDFAQYSEVVGLIRGLESSKSHIQDLSRNYMDDEDD